MKRVAVWVLLAGMLALSLWGCREKGAGTARDANTPAAGRTAKQSPRVQPVPEGPGGTAGTARPGQTPGAPGDATTAPGAVAGDVLTQQKNAYVQGAEQILNNIEQKFTAWQQQASAQGQPVQANLQELSKQVQQQLADARAAVDKMRNATGTQLKDAKVTADQAIRNVETAFQNLQSQASQTQVTQAQ